MTDTEPTTDAPPPPRARRWAKRIAIAVLLVVVGVPTVLLGLLHTASVQEALRARIEQRASERINGTVKVGELSFSLFSGEVHLGGVEVVDAEGEPAVGIVGVDVGLDLGRIWETRGRHIEISSLAIDGVTLLVNKAEDGSSNLSRLRKSAAEASSAKPSERTVAVRDLAVSRVEVTYQKADGLRLVARNVGVRGSLDVAPADSTFRVDLDPIRTDLEVGKGLWSVSLSQCQTGLHVALDKGAGTVSLARTRGEVEVRTAMAEPRRLPWRLGGVNLEVAPGQLGVKLEQLMAGVLALDALEVDGRLKEGVLDGDQRAELLGLKLEAKKLNELAGRDILKQDLALELALAGPQNKVAVEGNLKAGRAKAVLGGEIDVADPAKPHLDVKVTLTEVATRELLADPAVAPVVVDRLELTAKGNPEDRKLRVTAHGTAIQVRDKTIDDVELQAGLEGRVVKVERVAAQALGQTVLARGEYDLDKKHVDATITLAADVGRLLERLRARGVESKLKVAPEELTLEEGVAQVHVVGELDDVLQVRVDIEKLPVGRGTLSAHLNAKLKRLEGGDIPFEPLDVDGDIALRRVYLDPLLAWRGRYLKDLTAAVSADITLRDVPRQPVARARLLVEAQPFDAPELDFARRRLELRTQVEVVPNKAEARVDVVGVTPLPRTERRFLQVKGEVPLDRVARGLAVTEPWRWDVALPLVSTGELRPYLPPRVRAKLARDADVQLAARVRGTPAEPWARLSLDAQTSLKKGSTMRLAVRSTGVSPPAYLENELKLYPCAIGESCKPLGDGIVDLHLSRWPLRTWPIARLPKPSLRWDAHFNLPKKTLASLKLPMPWQGWVEAHLRARGENRAVNEVVLDLELSQLNKYGQGPFDAHARLEVNAEKTTVAIDGAVGDAPLVKGRGSVAIGGRDLLASPRSDWTKAALEVDLDVIQRPLASLSPVATPLEKLPGVIGGKIEVRGTVGEPQIDGAIAWDGFETLNDKPGRVAVELATVDNQTLRPSLVLGAQKNVAIAADVARADLPPFLKARRCEEEPCRGTLPVAARVRTKPGTDLSDLVPGFVAGEWPLDIRGDFEWTLDGSLVLESGPQRDETGKVPLRLGESSTVEGEMVLLNGRLGLPGTKRVYERISLRMLQGLDAIEIPLLEVHESDEEKEDRSLKAEAKVVLARLKPQALTARVKADDWLLFGDGPAPNARLGSIDAPRGALDADIVATGSLNESIKKVKVDVRQLDLSVPYRYNRSHWPEVTDLGDVVVLKRGLKATTKRALIGRLPHRPPSKPVPFNAAGKEGLDVDVTFSRPGHLQLQNLNLVPTGVVHYQRRGEGKR
ncbi:MAG: hypothetical protein AAGA56_06260, partial [Myxococcota bacterium]